MKKFFTNLLTLAVSSLIMFAIGEAVVRAVFSDDVVLFPRYHTDVQYGDFTLRRTRPNSDYWHTSVDGRWHFASNNQGFRNYSDFDYAKPQGKLRVLAVGDSHTQGYEVRQGQTFAAIIEKYLQAHDMPAEVINAGVSGFSTAEVLAFVEHEGLRYQPDAIVLGFYRNDLEDNVKAGLYTLDSEGKPVVARTEHIPGVRIQNFIYAIPGIQWLSENSYLYSIVFNATWEFFKQRLAASRSEEVVTEYATPQIETYSSNHLDLGIALLQRLYEICQSHGIRLVILDIPAVPAREDDGGGTMRSSLPDPVRAAAETSSDAFIDSMSLLKPYDSVAEIHVAHGQRHISEFTHTMLGVAAGQRLVEMLPVTE